jgi:hypothetical protein
MGKPLSLRSVDASLLEVLLEAVMTITKYAIETFLLIAAAEALFVPKRAAVAAPQKAVMEKEGARIARRRQGALIRFIRAALVSNSRKWKEKQEVNLTGDEAFLNLWKHISGKAELPSATTLTTALIVTPLWLAGPSA